MALNDPNWGRRGEGPPDLDEIWNRFRQRLAGLFGGRGGGRRPGNGGGKSLPGGAWLLVALVMWGVSLGTAAWGTPLLVRSAVALAIAAVGILLMTI